MENDAPRGKELTLFVRKELLASGFSACGIAKVEKLQNTEKNFKEWLGNGYNGSMNYMSKNLDKRLDPSLLVPGAKSIVIAALNYFPSEKQNPKSNFLISKYAYGVDYHQIVKERLNLVASKIKTLVPRLEYRVFADSAPVAEKEWAVRSGLGWIGKNACLILPKKGSYFFLGEIISNLELEPDKPFIENLCGSCNKCLEACPTRAIVSPGIVDARRCISYLTIESRSPIPDSLRDKTGTWIFGCDTCQDVCPHNRFSFPTTETAFGAIGPIKGFDDEKWLAVGEKTFKDCFSKGKSPISRVKFNKFADNISAAKCSLKKHL